MPTRASAKLGALAAHCGCWSGAFPGKDCLDRVNDWGKSPDYECVRRVKNEGQGVFHPPLFVPIALVIRNVFHQCVILMINGHAVAFPVAVHYEVVDEEQQRGMPDENDALYTVFFEERDTCVIHRLDVVGVQLRVTGFYSQVDY